MILRWFWRFIRCPHDQMIRERRSTGALDVRCSRCGYAVPLIARTPRELAAFRARKLEPPKARPQRPADVRTFRRPR
jgi:hypothetical protein